MRDALVAEDLELVLLVRGRHGPQEPVELLCGIVITTGGLHRGASAEVELPLGECAGTATGRRALKDKHIGPASLGLEGGAGARDPETDDHQVSAPRPLVNVGGSKRYLDDRHAQSTSIDEWTSY